MDPNIKLNALFRDILAEAGKLSFSKDYKKLYCTAHGETTDMTDLIRNAQSGSFRMDDESQRVYIQYCEQNNMSAVDAEKALSSTASKHKEYFKRYTRADLFGLKAYSGDNYQQMNCMLRDSGYDAFRPSKHESINQMNDPRKRFIDAIAYLSATNNPYARIATSDNIALMRFEQSRCFKRDVQIGGKVDITSPLSASAVTSSYAALIGTWYETVPNMRRQDRVMILYRPRAVPMLSLGRFSEEEEYVLPSNQRLAYVYDGKIYLAPKEGNVLRDVVVAVPEDCAQDPDLMRFVEGIKGIKTLSGLNRFIHTHNAQFIDQDELGKMCDEDRLMSECKWRESESVKAGATASDFLVEKYKADPEDCQSIDDAVIAADDAARASAQVSSNMTSHRFDGSAGAASGANAEIDAKVVVIVCAAVAGLYAMYVKRGVLGHMLAGMRKRVAAAAK